MSTKTLVIDTATDQGVLALFSNDKLLIESSLGRGSNLMPQLQDTLARVGVSPQDLGRLVVGAGPGSYTGLRMGAIVGKTLSWSLGIPLVGVPGIAAYIPPEEGPFVGAIDAKIGGVYLCVGHVEEEGIRYQGKPYLASIEELEAILTPAHWLVTGDREKIASRLSRGGGIRFVERGPDAHQLFRLGEAAFSRGEGSVQGELELHYLRTP